MPMYFIPFYLPLPTIPITYHCHCCSDSCLAHSFTHLLLLYPLPCLLPSFLPTTLLCHYYHYYPFHSACHITAHYLAFIPYNSLPTNWYSLLPHTNPLWLLMTFILTSPCLLYKTPLQIIPPSTYLLPLLLIVTLTPALLTLSPLLLLYPFQLVILL